MEYGKNPFHSTAPTITVVHRSQSTADGISVTAAYRASQLLSLSTTTHQRPWSKRYPNNTVAQSIAWYGALAEVFFNRVENRTFFAENT